MRDVIAGRLDMAVLDPGLVQYALLQHPEWGLHQVALVPEPDKFPIMSTKYYSIMGIYPENKELYEAINAEIAKAWASCANVKTMSASLIGRLGSSAFRLSTPAVSTSLAGWCFSPESAQRPFHHGVRR